MTIPYRVHDSDNGQKKENNRTNNDLHIKLKIEEHKPQIYFKQSFILLYVYTVYVQM
jgi:hypothetical protein